jgi:DNA-binding NtrC family response regulator
MASHSILVVDDEPDLRELVQITLERAGHRVVTAENGRKAGEVLARQAFDLVITDVLMPERDGIELIGEVRKKYPHMRIIVMTAGGQVPRGDYLLIARRLGAHVPVEKPFTGQQILDAVAAAMPG